jgi:gliding motility-associated-like protein
MTSNGSFTDTSIYCAGSAPLQQLQGAVGSCYSSPTYQWQESAGNGQAWTDIPGETGLAYSVLPTTAGVYSYRLTAAQSGNINISSCKVASAPITVVLVKIPSPAVTISAASSGICAGAPAAFTAQPTDGGSTPLYQWLVNGAPVSAAGPTYISNTFTNADLISCMMTSDAACAINPTIASNTIALTVTPTVVSSVAIAASATTICQDSLVNFTATPSNGGSHPAYQWMVNNQLTGQDTSFYSSATLKDGDVVSVGMLGSLYCSVPETSNTVTMTVYPVPTITLAPDTIIAAGSSLRLSPTVTGQVLYYQWSPAVWLDLPDSPDPMASPVTTTTYRLIVMTGNGCYAMAKETVGVFYDLLMPRAFTPNGDGKNDLFRIPPSVPVSVLQFSVYNRWGGLVFSTSNSSAGWDGRSGNKLQPAGVYVWWIEYVDPLTKNRARKNGTVELIR